MVSGQSVPEELKSRVPSCVVFLIAFFIALAGAFYFIPRIRMIFQKKELSEVFEGQEMHQITLALDSYAGYTIAQSQSLRQKLRGYKIRLSVINEPDFKKRVELFSQGKVDLMCITVDAYLKNGAQFMEGDLLPGPVVSVISESRGADAIFVSKQAQVKTINDLGKEGLTVALTPDSPSEFLSVILAENFGLERWKKGSQWKFETNGSEEARKALEKGKVQAAVVWEPDVSILDQNKDVFKLHDSGKNRMMILDIMVASPEFVKQQRLLDIYLRSYFRTLEELSNNEEMLEDEIYKFTGLKKSLISGIVRRIEWYDLYANAVNLFGLRGLPGADYHDVSESLIESMDNVSFLLAQSGYLKSKVRNIMVQNPYNMLNSSFIKKLSQGGIKKTVSFKREYSPLSEKELLSLPVAGNLKIEPIEFKSGLSQLSRKGYATVDKIARILKTYEYRIIVEGHTEPGDPSIVKPLSQDRCDAVQRVLIHTHGISSNRILAKGYGDSKPFEKGTMSRREWYRKLRRVEIVLVKDSE